MPRLHSLSVCAFIFVMVLTYVSDQHLAWCQELDVPVVKFFYYDEARIEWVFSSELERFEQHLRRNPESERLINSTAAAVGESQAEEARRQMTRWITQERERFDKSGGNTARFRKAEGIVAYLRAHDFRVSKLVEALKKRSGASEIELVAVHLVNEAGENSYKLKVVPVDATIEIGKQGFNVDVQSPDVSYLSAVYALGLALYEIHEIINADSPADGQEGQQELEPLPLPDVRTTPPAGVDSLLPPSGSATTSLEYR